MPITKEDIAESIQQNFDGALVQTLNDTSPAFRRLDALGKVVTNTGAEIRWPAIAKEYDGVTNIADGGTLPEAAQEKYAKALLEYAIFIGTIRIGRLLRIGNRNRQEFFIDLQRQTTAALRQIARKIHFQIVADNRNNNEELTGLGESIDKNDNEYAGIDRNTNAFWQPYINAGPGGNRPLTEALLRDVYDTLTQVRGARTTEVWCGTTAWNSLEDILKNPVRTNDPQNLRGGALTIEWKGIPFLKMPDQNPNSMRWLDFETDDGIQLQKQHEEDFLTNPETTNSYDDRVSIAGHYQLVTRNPHKQGALLNVA